MLFIILGKLRISRHVYGTVVAYPGEKAASRERKQGGIAFYWQIAQPREYTGKEWHYDKEISPNKNA